MQLQSVVTLNGYAVDVFVFLNWTNAEGEEIDFQFDSFLCCYWEKIHVSKNCRKVWRDKNGRKHLGVMCCDLSKLARESGQYHICFWYV